MPIRILAELRRFSASCTQEGSASIKSPISRNKIKPRESRRARGSAEFVARKEPRIEAQIERAHRPRFSIYNIESVNILITPALGGSGRHEKGVPSGNIRWKGGKGLRN